MWVSALGIVHKLLTVFMVVGVIVLMVASFAVAITEPGDQTNSIVIGLFSPVFGAFFWFVYSCIMGLIGLPSDKVFWWWK